MTAFTLTITGDSIINHRIRDIEDTRFLQLMSVLQDSTVAVTHFESLIHDYAGPDLHPAAEAGWTWMRSPAAVTEELAWLGIDAVSLASNHAGDYGTGGLVSTWAALERAGIPHAGTGPDLDTARAPAFFFDRGRKFALVSMSSSVPASAIAASARGGIGGRPGVNPLRFQHRVDAATMGRIEQLATELGFWCEQSATDRWLVHPPGLHNSIRRFEVDDDVDGARIVADPADWDANLAAVRDAAARSDVAIVHIHNHEWDPEAGLEHPPAFIAEFARACIDVGAAVVVAEGSHAPFRGIELHRDGVIFYDPGELFMQSRHVTRLPQGFYERQQASPGDGIADVLGARNVKGRSVVSPPGGYRAGPVDGGYLATVSFDDAFVVTGVELVPYDRHRLPGEHGDVPRLARPETATAILSRVDELSAPYGTRVREASGRGIVTAGTDPAREHRGESGT